MNPVSKYFNGEKIQCAIGIVFGVLSISIALYLLFKSNKPFHPDSYRQGIAYPFIIIPVLLMIICVGVVVRSAKDIVRVDNIIQNDRSKISSNRKFVTIAFSLARSEKFEISRKIKIREFP